MKTLYILENSIQGYAWGSTDGIPSFTGIKNGTGKPMAELWMGAHPGAPSRIASGQGIGDAVSLDAFIDRDPGAVLGAQTARLFGNRLPFLFKVLSAASPLSLQVHPTKQQAESGFTRDNLAGIPLSSPDRNYRDDNHKPEIIMAVTPFTAMCGFRTVAETVSLFAAAGIPALAPFLAELEKNGTYTSFCKNLLDLPESETKAAIAQVLQRARTITTEATETKEGRAFALVLDLADQYPADIGVFAPLYLNVVDLAPGEALYLRAGIMHAYVRGTGLELMASSDNVLRGGLTPKHIDIPELLSVLDPLPYAPAVLPPGKKQGLHRYRTESTELELCRLAPGNGTHAFEADRPAILVGAEGIVTVGTGAGESIEIRKGTTVFAAATKEKLIFSGKGICYLASMPGWEPAGI